MGHSAEREARVVLCGNGCGHDHNALNGPTGCCTVNPEHGPYLYFCQPCHDEWAAANPERVEEIRRLASKVKATRTRLTPPAEPGADRG